jgi:adenine-specific DNA-methyltransferase
MTEKKEIKISAAKGRPMLTWVGKRPLRHVTAFPAQNVETFAPVKEISEASKTPEIWKEWPAAYPKGGLLFHGDNKEVLAHLLANGFRGKVKLIYIDPPFDSGADYVRKVQLRGSAGTAKIEGESYTLGEQIQYTDIWANDNYLQFMYERLMLLKELLAEDGSLYLHCDTHRTHHLRCLLEEVFGPENLRNEIIWQRFNFRADGKKFGTVHDTIYLATKSDKYFFEKPYVELKPSYIKSHFRPDKDGRLYRLDNLTAPSHGKPGKPLKFGEVFIAPV